MDQESPLEPRLVFRLPGAEKQRHALPDGETALGRSPDCELCLDDRSVSRLHCRITRRGQRVWIERSSPSNPTLVDGQEVEKQILRHGAVIRLGRVHLRYLSRVSSGAPVRERSPRGTGRAHRRPLRSSRSSPLVPVLVGSLLLGLGVLAFWLTRPGDEPTPGEPAPSSPVLADLGLPPTPGSGRRVAEIPRDIAGTLPGGGSEASDASPAGSPEVTEPVEETAEPADEGEVPEVAGVSEVEGDPSGSDPAGVTGETSGETPPGTTVGRLGAASADEAYFQGHVVPFFARYCTSCHGAEKEEGDLTLHEFHDYEALVADRELWELVATQVRKGRMPPDTARQPAERESRALVEWIDAAIFDRREGQGVDPGRVTIRRLNNAEYNHTIRDLVGLDLQPARGFPADEIGYGFDNIGDILSIPPLLMEKYLAAAERIVEAVWKDEKARDRILFRKPKRSSQHRSVALAVLRPFASRAFRRPATSTELSRLYKLVQLGVKEEDDFEFGIRLALQAILTSPHFLFRVELDDRPGDPDSIHPLDDHELASRLSYFLWSSMPDDELFQLAGKKQLRKKSVLREQTLRMLADPRSRGMVETFAELWLGVRQMESVTPDPASYPSFSDALRRDMQEETRLFFTEILRKDLSVLNFIESDFTFLNERLARHYGIDDVEGDVFRLVKLEEKRRGGVLTQGTVLTITSNPTRTSPVKRGKWILEQILGTPPPPPPPGADSLDEEELATGAATLRETLARHRADPACATCHEKMDTLGLAFENFDGVGAWRRFEGETLIRAAGSLPGGRDFESVPELKGILVRHHARDFRRSLVEKMLTFALGRGIEYSDTDEVERIAGRLEREDDRFSVLILEIVQSDLFVKRRGERSSP